MKKFYCCDYCDELFETETECKVHEATCPEKKDYDECRKMDKDSLILHLREFIEEVEIFNEAYGADIVDDCVAISAIASMSAMILVIVIAIVKTKKMMKITMMAMKPAMKISTTISLAFLM